MYYLCGADVILRIASEVKKRVNAARIGRFPGFDFVHLPWLWKMLERCLQRVIWRIKTVANACFNVYGDESRTRIARSPFSTKNQMDRINHKTVTLLNRKKQCHPSHDAVHSCVQGSYLCVAHITRIRRCLTSLIFMSSGHDGMTQNVNGGIV